MYNRRINILVMPTDSCNMNCKYCFHECFHPLDNRMSYETLEKLYDISCGKCPSVQFIWHGGEPLLMGIDFYRYALDKQKKYTKTKVRNTMQSNLTLITDDMAEFLCTNNVGMGTSFDGILNDELRGCTERILSGRQKILDHGGKCGVIMVVSAKNVDTLEKSYEMFKELNINYGLNTYVSRGSELDEEYELDPDKAIRCFTDFFDTWIHDKECNIHVDYFERIVEYISSGKKTVCKNTSCIGRWIGVRSNGTIVPCNRFFPDEYSFGNVWDYDSIFDAFDSPGAIRLISEAIERRKKCSSCGAYGMCEGGCNNVAYNEGGIKNNGGSTCEMTKSIYTYIYNYFEERGICEIENPMVRRILKARNKHLGKSG